MSRYDWFSKWSLYSPDKDAVVEPKRRASYGELDVTAARIAGVLHHHHGLSKGDRIAVLAGFSIELIALFGAAQKAGFILVPINTRLTQREVEYQIQDSGASAVIAEEIFDEKLAQSLDQVLRFSDLDRDADVYENDLTDEDPIFILYTSGTTGFPKGAVYTHGMLFWNSENTAMRLDLTSNDITVNCMPAFHTGGWNVLITPLLHRGGTVWLQNDFDADRVLKCLDESQSTLFMAVPTMLKMMVDADSFESVKLENLRYFIVGGEALPIPMIETWAEKGIPIRQGYGMTEVGPNVTSLHQNDNIRKRGSIGFFNFYIDGKLINDRGEECATDEVGELWLSGPNVTPGYWHNDEANQDSFSGQWFKTGDLMRMDVDGYLYVAGRKKEMYISGGENVYPREVEHILQKHRSISEVAVIGVPDEKWGESGAAFIVAKGTPPTINELKDHCQKNLAKFKIPTYFFFVDRFPLNSTGKIDKKELSKSIKLQKPQNHENE
jgi:fatty-acyl-CoA synthase